MNLRRRAVSAVSWSAVQAAASVVTGTLTLVILSRLLPPAAFGLVALGTLYVGFVQVFVEQGFGDALVQKEEVEPEHLDTVFWCGLGAAVVLMGLSVAAAPYVAAAFHQPELAPVIRWLSPALLFPALGTVQQALLRRRLAFKALAVRGTAAAVVGGLAGIVAALRGMGVYALVVQSLVTGLVGTVVLWRVTDWRPSFRVSPAHFRELFGFGVNVVGTNVLAFVGRNADDLLIGYFLGPVLLGYYSVAYRLVRMVAGLIRSVTNGAAFPVFARVQTDLERIRRAYYMGAHYTTMVALPVFVGMSITAPELVRAAFGPQWGPSVPVMRVLAFVGLLQTVFAFNTSVIMALGKARWRFSLTLLNAALDVVAFVIAVPWGIVAVASAYVVRNYLTAPLPIWAVHRLVGLELRTFLAQYRTPALCTVAMAAAVLGTQAALRGAAPLVQVGVEGLVGAVVYAAAAVVLRVPLLQHGRELLGRATRSKLA